MGIPLSISSTSAASMAPAVSAAPAYRRVQELHKKFQMYGKNAREWMRKCALLLPEIERERVWEMQGFGSIYEYAAKLAGMSRDAVNEALRILHKTEQMPAVCAVIAERGINAVKPIVGLLTDANQEFWAEKARVMSKHTLETYVRELRRQNELIGDASGDARSANHPVGLDIIGRPGTAESDGFSQQQAMTIVMELEPEVAAQLEKLKGRDDDWNTLMKEFLQMRDDALAADQPEAVTAMSRHIPVKIRRYVSRRSRGRCEFPGCTRSYDILHHTQRFALERVHDPQHIVPLCTAHERIVHLGLVAEESDVVREWRVRAHADERDPRYEVDRVVGKYRVGGRIT